MSLTREQELDIFLNTAIGSLKEKRESKLGLQIIKWVEEKQKIKFEDFIRLLKELIYNNPTLYPEEDLSHLIDELAGDKLI